MSKQVRVSMVPLNAAHAVRARRHAVRARRRADASSSVSAPPPPAPQAVRGWTPGPDTALILSGSGRPLLTPSTTSAPGGAVFGSGNASFVELTLAPRKYISGEEQINGGFGFAATPPAGRQDFYAWFSCDGNGLYTGETGSSSLAPCGVGSNISITNAASVLTLLLDGKPVGALGRVPEFLRVLFAPPCDDQSPPPRVNGLVDGWVGGWVGGWAGVHVSAAC